MHIGDVIELATLIRNVAYHEFFNSMKFHIKLAYMYNFGPKVHCRPEEYNVLMVGRSEVYT